MQCLPDSLLGRSYYRPTDQGLEIRYQERLKQIKAWKALHAPRAPRGLEKIILAFFARNRYTIDTFYIYWRDDG